jgi:hypothetical protein
MGWKNVKEEYHVKHTVQVTRHGICIGSPYIHDIIVIGLDGIVKKRYDGTNEDLSRVQREMDGKPGVLARTVLGEDTFAESVDVYTYDCADIIKKQCEVLGFPNITHDGMLMYANTFSADKLQVVAWAKLNLKLWIDNTREQTEECEQRLTELTARLTDQEAGLAKLKDEYPGEI